jgi:hypothetical protein
VREVPAARMAHVEFVSISRYARLILGNKQQNRRNSAREIVPKSLGFIGRMFGARTKSYFDTVHR